MCTRFYVRHLTPELREILEEAKNSPLLKRFIVAGSQLKTDGEVRPTDVVAAIAPNPRGERKVFPMKFGYTNPFKGGKLILNARSETAYEKPTFKYDWLNHRCIIPATCYIEWCHNHLNDGTTQLGERYLIQPEGAEVTWLCGLYHIENNFPTFVILTREPGSNIEFIHDRMPLILPENLINEWIRPGINPMGLLEHALTDMVAVRE